MQDDPDTVDLRCVCQSAKRGLFFSHAVRAGKLQNVEDELGWVIKKYGCFCTRYFFMESFEGKALLLQMISEIMFYGIGGCFSPVADTQL